MFHNFYIESLLLIMANVVASSESDATELVSASQVAVPSLQVTGSAVAAPLTPVNYEDERVRKNSDWQIKWNGWMSDVQKNSSIYKHVSVLLIAWDKECDSLQVHDEV